MLVTRRNGGAIRRDDVVMTKEDFSIQLTLDHAAYVYVGGWTSLRQSIPAVLGPRPRLGTLVVC